MHRGIIGAANQNRTDDLILTKDVLYQLSHSSVSQIDEHYYIRKLVVCQVFFELFLKPVNLSARTVGFVMAGSEFRCDDFGVDKLIINIVISFELFLRIIVSVIYIFINTYPRHTER